MTRTHPYGDNQILEEGWRSALTHRTWKRCKIILSFSIWGSVFLRPQWAEQLYTSFYVFKSTFRGVLGSQQKRPGNADGPCPPFPRTAQPPLSPTPDRERAAHYTR